MMKHCIECGSILKEEYKYCRDCGSRIPNEIPEKINHCPDCGNKIQEDHRFCENCGFKIQKSKKTPILLDKPNIAKEDVEKSNEIIENTQTGTTEEKLAKSPSISNVNITAQNNTEKSEEKEKQQESTTFIEKIYTKKFKLPIVIMTLSLLIIIIVAIFIFSQGKLGGVIVDDDKPNADFIMDISSSTVSFTGMSTDQNGMIIQSNWNFGDGATSSAQNPTHQYVNPGTYTVVLTVTDNDGKTASISKKVTITTTIQNPDTDHDGFPDDTDSFPNNPSEWKDTDGDGHGDNGDAFSTDPTQWSDRDKDGYGDNSNGNNPDKFPDNPAEWKDTDGDGHGDNGDAFSTDPTQWSDRDKDGYGDNSNGNNPDKFPDNPAEWKDNDNDGLGDNSDIDDDNDGYTDTEDYLPYQNAILKVTISKYKVIDEVDSWPDNTSKAHIYFEVYIDTFDNLKGRFPNTDYWTVDVGKFITLNNRDVEYDVPDNVQTHSVKIIMYDQDWVTWRESLDIDGLHTGSDQNALTMQYDIVTQKWSGDDNDGISDGSDDGSFSTDDNDAYIEYNIQLI